VLEVVIKNASGGGKLSKRLYTRGGGGKGGFFSEGRRCDASIFSLEAPREGTYCCLPSPNEAGGGKWMIAEGMLPASI